MKWNLLIFVILIINIFVTAYAESDNPGYQFKLIRSFNLEQKIERLGRIYNFAVDESENIFIPDSANSNIKVYNSVGKLIRIMGRKGAGPSEFIDPVRISINKDTVVIADVGALNYKILDRNFNEVNRFFFLLSGQPFVITDKVIISNEFWRENEKRQFRGVIIDFSGKNIKGLIEIKRPFDIWEAVIDSYGYIDFSGAGDIFLVKSGNVLIYKFDKEGNFINTFGHQPPYFIPPKRSKDFENMVKWGRAPQGREAGERWYRSSSWVSGLFTLEKTLGIAIRTFNQKESKWDCSLQLYDFNGNIIEDNLKLLELSSSSNTGFSICSDHKQRVYVFEERENYHPESEFRIHVYELKR